MVSGLRFLIFLLLPLSVWGREWPDSVHKATWTHPLETRHYLLQFQETAAKDPMWLYMMGMTYAGEGKYDSALQFQQVALDGFYEQANRKFQAKALNEMGICYDYLGNYKLAIDFYFRALSIFKELGDQRGMADAYNNIGIIFQYQGNTAKALGFFYNGLRISQRIDYQPGVLNAWNSLGMSYEALGDFRKALEYYLRVLAFDLQSNDKANLGGSYNNAGTMFLKLGQLDSAEYYLQQALYFKKSVGKISLTASTLNTLGELSLLRDKPEKAKTYLQEALEVSRYYSVPTHEMDALLHLSRLHKEQQQYEQSLLLLERYHQLKDSLADVQSREAIEKLNADYEMALKDKSIAETQTALSRETQRQGLFALVSVFLFLLVSLLAWQAYRSKRFNQELLQANAKLESSQHETEAALRARTNFLSLISHEIRTPLNAILSITTLLKNRDTAAGDEQLAQILDFSARNLLYMMNNLLDANRLEAGKLSLSRQAFDLEEFLKRSIAAYEFQAAEKGLQFQGILPEIRSPRVIGDEQRLGQILNNLLTNALKFTPKGSITLSVTKTDTPDTYRFQVRDTGIGISEADQEKVFGMFTQADTSHTRQYGGAGIGLYLCSQLLHLMGSSLNLESETGKGSTFYFELYLPATTPLTVEEAKSTAAVSLLLVEDNKVNAFLLQKLLEEKGFRVNLAENGLEALQHLNQQSFDLVLMDLQMPVMDGYEAIQRIRQHADWQKLPVIAFTAELDEGELEKDLRKAGFNAMIGKPVNPDELQAVIRELSV